MRPSRPKVQFLTTDEQLSSVKSTGSRSLASSLFSLIGSSVAASGQQEQNGRSHEEDLNERIHSRVNKMKRQELVESILNSKLAIKMTKVLLRDEDRKLKGSLGEAVRRLQTDLETIDEPQITQTYESTSLLEDYFHQKSRNEELKSQISTYQTMCNTLRQMTIEIHDQNTDLHTKGKSDRRRKEELEERYRLLRRELETPEPEYESSSQCESRWKEEAQTNGLAEANQLIHDYNKLIQLHESIDTTIKDIECIESSNNLTRDKIIDESKVTNMFNSVVQKYNPKLLEHLQRKAKEISIYVTQVKELENLVPGLRNKLDDIHFNFNEESNRVEDDNNERISGTEEMKDVLDQQRINRWIKNKISKNKGLRYTNNLHNQLDIEKGGDGGKSTAEEKNQFPWVRRNLEVGVSPRFNGMYEPTGVARQPERLSLYKSQQQIKRNESLKQEGALRPTVDLSEGNILTQLISPELLMKLGFRGSSKNKSSNQAVDPPKR